MGFKRRPGIQDRALPEESGDRADPEDGVPRPAHPVSDPGGESVADGRLFLRLAILAVVIYTIVSFAMSSLRFTGFFGENWDLGIMQQALWSTSHGHPMFEAGDYEELGVYSLFQVHPSFLVFLLAVPYALAPSAFTLFAIQSVAVGAAGLPLYYLTRSLTASSRKALVTVVLFLTWLPLLSSQLYDFHLEAFLPVELFTTLYFWQRRSYPLTVVSAIISMLTLEIAPLFVVAMAAFFGLPPIRPLLREVLGSLRRGGGSARTAEGPRGRPLLDRHLRYLRRSEVLFALGMVNVAVAVYFLLRLLQGPYVALVLGASVPPSGNLWGFTASSFGLSPAFIGVYLTKKLTYWAILYGLVLFLPLLRPRSLILVLPWLTFTFLSPTWNYVTMGYQYGLVASFPVFAGVAYGMDLFPLTSIREAGRALRAALGQSAGTSAGVTVHGGRPPMRLPPAPALGSLGLGSLIVVGLLLSPITPWMQSSAIPEGSAAPGYWGRYSVPPAYERVVALAGSIPAGASIVASTDLFPFVANDVNAYATLWYPGDPPNLPFNLTHLPQYVLVSQVMAGYLPTWLAPLLTSAQFYGERAYVPGSPVGAVLLYEQGFVGNATSYGPGPAPTLGFLTAPTDLPSGAVLSPPGRTCQDVRACTRSSMS